MLFANIYQYRQNYILTQRIKKSANLWGSLSRHFSGKKLTGKGGKDRYLKDQGALEKRCSVLSPVFTTAAQEEPKGLLPREGSLEGKGQRGVRLENQGNFLAMEDGETREQKENWDERVRDYLLYELNSSEDDYLLYRELSGEMRSLRSSLEALAGADPWEKGVPLETKEELLQIRETLVSELQERLGSEGFESMYRYEQQVKAEMFEEYGFYGDYGFF